MNLQERRYNNWNNWWTGRKIRGVSW